MFGGLFYLAVTYALGRRLRLLALPEGLPKLDRDKIGPRGLFFFPFDLLTGAVILTSLLYVNLHLTQIWMQSPRGSALRAWLSFFGPDWLRGISAPMILMQAVLLAKVLSLAGRSYAVFKGAKKDLWPLLLWDLIKLGTAAAGLILLNLGFFFIPLLLLFVIAGRFLWYGLFSLLLKLSRWDWEIRLKPFLALSGLMLLALAWGFFLCFPTYFLKDGVLNAGYTVFSDLAPHSALVRSFGIGGNIPAQYPHFSGAGMRYHFFFYFLAGILNRLGMPLDWALNLPSMLGTLAFCQGLGWFALELSGRLAAWPLCLLLFAFRSSFSGFVLLFDKLRAGTGLTSALAELRAAEHYAGPLLHDDWGLYNLNVYANQRHLLWGLALLLYILLLFWPYLRTGVPLRDFFGRTSWGSGIVNLAYLFLLAFPMAYWHGSAAICLLLILALWALFSRAKGAYLFFGLTAAGGAFGWKYYMEQGFRGAPRTGSIFQWGYILEDRSLFGVLGFFGLLFGLAFLLLVLQPFIRHDRAEKIFAAALFLPSLFGLLFSLTPDVTVNHKYFMMTLLLGLPFIASTLIALWERRRHRIACRLLTLLMLFTLCFTGLTDFWAYRNQSRFRVSACMHDGFTEWLEANSEPGKINLTPPWAFHSYFLCGRQAFYGHPYYAASAGYPTEKRLSEIRSFLAADLLPEELRAYAAEHNLEYLMIDDGWRSDRSYYINENALAEIFPAAAFFPEYGNLTVYDLR